MKLKHILYILCAIPFLWGCNDEDDINEIFASGPWYVVNYFTKADWNKRNGEPIYKLDTSEGQETLVLTKDPCKAPLSKGIGVPTARTVPSASW